MSLFKIIFFVPKDEAEKVKNAMFDSGAGKIGNYSHCSFESEGVGQFMPNDGAKPTLGTIGGIEKVKELKVEMICKEELLKGVITSMKKAHSYEEVAYDIIKLENHHYE